MPAPKGNKFWEQRSSHGRDALFASPQLLWEAACEYFTWCENNPLLEEKAFAYQGIVTKNFMRKARVFTLTGLCLYIDCNEAYLRANKESKDLSTVINKIYKTIYDQKFTGAASDIFNAGIISRDLGLVEKTQMEAKVNTPSPLDGMTTADLLKKLEELADDKDGIHSGSEESTS